MKRSGKYLLGIFFNITITIFLVLSLFGFVPMLSKYHRDILILIVAGKWLIEMLVCSSRMHEKEDKDKK